LGTGSNCGSGSGVTTSPTTNPVTPTSTCPLAALTPITDPQAKSMEAGQTILWTSSISNVQQNLTALQTAYGKFQTAIKSVGDSGTLSSVYRPLAYQTHLYNIYQSAIQLQNNPNDNSIAACSSIISALKAEEQKHGICTGGGHPCLVGKPTACAPHVAGIGIDITLTGPVGYSAINATLKQNNVGLHFQGLSGDPVHFQLDSPPGGSCANSS
jgi:D-alanyl-D-alanine dipeptidase